MTWTPRDSDDLFRVSGWGNGYFSIGAEGRLRVHRARLAEGSPVPDESGAVDLKALVGEVRQRGIDLPVLLRFSDLIEARVREINEAFGHAIESYEYEGRFQGVFPIKVNQDRSVVQCLIQAGEPWHYGLEAGSKPELLAAVAMLQDPEALIVCNGYKDDAYIETALLASQLGHPVIVVLEKPAEVDVVIRMAEKTGVAPRIGLRAKLASRGAGHWEASGGDRSKFGLSGSELVDAVERLREAHLLESVELLHFHIGSQISSIRAIKDAIREAGWIYVNLAQMGAPMRYLDVGGGLGVDYDGTRTMLPSSMNYTLQEYANDVVYGVMEICDPAGIEHPVLVTESGRASVAHHAVLVVEVLGGEAVSEEPDPKRPDDDAELPLTQLWETYESLGDEGLLETYHDAVAYRDQCLNLFRLGHLSLVERGHAEELFRSISRRIYGRMVEREMPPEELGELEELLAETWFCNFSLFQSMPDSWAIDQLFPVVPLSGLDREPLRRAILADITCDSDGKIDRFIGDREIQKTLALPAPVAGEPYEIGLFLVGAYQEILGDLHNLFGDTHTVMVSLDGRGGYTIDEVRQGNTVNEVLRYVGYDGEDLVARIRRKSEEAVRSGGMSLEEARRLLEVFRSGLSGYTYLE